MDVQRQEDGDVPASISDGGDDDDDDDNDDDDDDDDDDAFDDPDDAGDDDGDAADNANDDDDVADDDVADDMDDGDSGDEIVACLHADQDESDLFSKSPRPQDSGSLQSLQNSQVPPASLPEAPT